MKHTEKCLAIQAEMKRKHDEYVAKWPNYCRKCGGEGGFSYGENQAPFGSGEVWTETLWDFCEHCVGNNKCPRCGADIHEEEDSSSTKCDNCNWHYDAPGCPPEKLEYPCECEYDFSYETEF